MKFNLNKKILTASAVLVLAVGVIVYVVAYAATVICPPVGCAAGAGAALTPGATNLADTFIGDGVAAGTVDVVDDGDGNDILHLGLLGDNVPCGAATDCLGDDFIDGGPGADVVGDALGAAVCANQANVLGNDFILGGRENALDGADSLCGGPGNDYLFGAAAGDTLAGNADNDVIVPGTGVDAVCNSGGAPEVAPCLGVAAPGGGDDVIIIYAGDVPGPPANELLFCGTGNDVFIFVGFSALPALAVAPGTAVVITDPITGGTYTVRNTGGPGATPCILTN